ncbi:MAG TPA: class I SAM-dependent methyltransferase [Stellaceae bacterium]|nr:class I SAM-dependent methyltransferase [Stellaceae bacterium]
MTAGAYAYPGGELELFEHARNWKRYWTARIRPFLGETVAEVGAGIGANTLNLISSRAHWTCIEPDSALAARIEQLIERGQLGANCAVRATTLAALPATSRFDTILYIDVLEHIADDRAELAEAARRLKPEGYLVVLGPAHQWLFTAFDSAIGHFRRYTAKNLRALSPPGLRPRLFQYLDSVGLLASLANVLVLKVPMPTQAQIRFWDRVMIPMSRLLDPLTGFRAGKSVLAVWQAPENATP